MSETPFTGFGARRLIASLPEPQGIRLRISIPVFTTLLLIFRTPSRLPGVFLIIALITEP